MASVALNATITSDSSIAAAAMDSDSAVANFVGQASMSALLSIAHGVQPQVPAPPKSPLDQLPKATPPPAFPARFSISPSTIRRG